jgi:hypothetical protein
VPPPATGWPPVPLMPIIAGTFPFDRIVDAHRFLESNEQFGKVVVTV